MNVNSKINQPAQATSYKPDTHPLALLDGMTNPYNLIWTFSSESLRNFFEQYYVITSKGKIKTKGHSEDFNRLKNKCYLMDETREWYELVQLELVPLVQYYFTERNYAMADRLYERDEKRKAALTNRLQRMDSIIHELELKGPRLLRYVAAMSLHKNRLGFDRRQYRLMLVRLEYFISLVVRGQEGGPPVDAELGELMQVMDAVTQAAIRGYVAGGWGRDSGGVVRLWPAVAAEPSVLTVGTGL